MPILGIDSGNASVGWALLSTDENGRATGIIAAGTRMFDPPEEKTQSGSKLKSAERRSARGQRRVIRRRRQRMNELRILFREQGLLPSADSSALYFPGVSPWAIRAAAQDRLLTDVELAVALGHMARHRGFKSNAKAAEKNDPEDSEMKSAMKATQDKLMGRTFGKLLATDEFFKGRMRNRQGEYERTPERKDIESEVRSLFYAQKRLQNKSASQALQSGFEAIAFRQKGLQDSEDKVGDCAFEPTQKRTARRAYSYEKFRFLARLNNLAIVDGNAERKISPNELSRALGIFGKTQKLTFTHLRKAIGLSDTECFATVKRDEEKADVVAIKGGAATGTAVFRKLLDGAAWDSLCKTPEKLDCIAEIITFKNDLERIKKGIEEIGLESVIFDAVMAGVEEGAFKDFGGVGHISALACRKVMEHLEKGHVYSCACGLAHYDHTASKERNIFNVGLQGKEALGKILKDKLINQTVVGSPVARKALIEAVKQVKTVLERYQDEHGQPEAIHIELAREVGKSIEERGKITTGIKKRNETKAWLREQFTGCVGRAPESINEETKFELAREQQWKCLYCDKSIRPDRIKDGLREFEIDHILPIGRFADDSYHCKTLACTTCNQNKRGNTPYEWMEHDPAKWDSFVARVGICPDIKRHKRKLYTLKNAKELEGKFKARNLNDARWTSRLLADILKTIYPSTDSGVKLRMGVCTCGENHTVKAEAGDRRTVFARPGAITARVRQGLGLQEFKYIDGKRKSDDRHHALDAIVVAATTEWQLQKLTELLQQEEQIGSPRVFRNFGVPWNGFRADADKVMANIVVSRAERHRARGKAHDATIRQLRIADGENSVYERKSIDKLTEADLDRIPVPVPHRKAVDPAKLRNEMVETLRNWLANGKPTDKASRPLSPNGNEIRKVRLLTTKKLDVEIRGGVAERGDMARVDIFSCPNKKGSNEFYAIPIYPHDIAREKSAPIRPLKSGGEEIALPVAAKFRFSLYQNSWVEIVKSDGEIVSGYFRKFDRNTVSITTSRHQSNLDIVGSRNMGIKTLVSFRKFTVDRLGSIHEIKSELRTWRGKVCMSPNLQG
jgi:CRISPR-associated endonuclease Csn1